MIGNLSAAIFTPAAIVGGDYESIATTIVTSGSPTSIDLTSIPSTYQHLQLRIVAGKGSPTDWVSLRFNGDTAGNYSYHRIRGTGSSAISEAGVSTVNIQIFIANASTTIFGASIVDILDYKDTNKFTTTRALSGYDTNGGGDVGLMSGNWRNTAAISSINISTSSTGFANNTHVALYGIKG